MAAGPRDIWRRAHIWSRIPLVLVSLGLRRIRLHGLRNTSVSLMLDQGHPPHIVAAWHGHDPAVALSIYADVKADELRVVGASLFG